MKILGIETSCDDTGIAMIKTSGKKNPKFKIISNIVSSQVELHKKYGGVYPSLAKREHQKNLVPVLEQALKEAKLLNKNRQTINNKKLAENSSLPTDRELFSVWSQKIEKILEREPELLKNLLSFLKKYQKPKIDLIAVTNGPGLEPCLWSGINFAKALALAWDLPIVPINHIEAHILANFVSDVKCLFPAVCLVVSGGHTQLILMNPVRNRRFSNGVKNFGKYQIIGETRDDAAGECFDKTARILGLEYPGGPAISAAAEKLPTTHYKLQTILPRPMIHQKNYDFSFSGLKTAVLYDFKKRPEKIRKSTEYIQEMAKEIQQAIIDVLIKKTIKAAKDFKAKTIILGGGVTANKELRSQFEEACLKWNFKHLVPSKNLCTDNAAMTAVTGYFHKPRKIEKIETEANLRL